MVWFFQRAGLEMRIVTRFDRSSREYVVEVEWPNRPAAIERYADYEAFNSRVQKLQVELLESRWEPHGMPALIADGWRGPTSSS